MRETRHLCVGNLPDNVREEKILEYFKRYGRIEKVKILSKRGTDGDLQAVVAFLDLRAAEKAHNATNTIGDKQLQTSYSEPAAMSSSSRHDRSPSPGSRHGQSTHRGHSSHRSDSKATEGHTAERSHSDRRRSHQGSSDSSRNPELSDSKSSQKAAKESTAESSSKKGEKKHKADVKSKKKQKKVEESGKNVSSKSSTKHKASRGRSPTVKKKSANRKQKRQGSSSEGERTTSSSYSSRTTGRSSSSSSNSTSVSSSRSNSLNSSSPRSTTAESDSEGGQKLVTMIIKKLPARPSVNNLREGIYHEFKKCGKVKSVVIRGDNNNRHALVLFRNASEANKSVNHAKSKLLFGAAIEASIYEGEVSGKELQECGGIIDEFHPRASRTLFVGNLDKTVGYSDIQNIFVRFGEIVAIEIKRQNNVPQYAFLQYTDIASVVKAIQKMDGEKLGKNTLKLGFGKTVISSCVWVAGVTESFTEHYLASCFQKHGPVEYVVIDRNRGQALVFYCKFEHAQQALTSLRGRKMNGSRLKLDYASHKLIELFLTDMQNSGQTATTFESIRHLILSAPTTPSAPPPTTSSSRSTSRPSSGHPYLGTPDTYYERYPPAPPAYDAAAPARSDWRAWEERNRGRPPYHSVSPRGRRAFDDDRPERSDLYHRDEECFTDRIPPSYEPEFSEYRREHSREYPTPPLPRGYTDDYHRGLKPRDRRDPVYHSRHSPGRIIRRSRSNSPRSGVPGRRGRMRDFDPKLETRIHDHRDIPIPRGRSPIRSPASREDRGSGSDSYSRKYRDHRYGSPAHYYSPPRRGPSPYGRRADERRVELREGRSLPDSPRSGGVRSKVVQDSSGQWPTTSSRSSSKPSESGDPWPAERSDYDRRSETPTRDENLDSIGEIIIKQPQSVVSSVITRTVKQGVGRQKSIDATSTKTDASTKSSSRASSTHSDNEGKAKSKLESVVSERPTSSRSALLQRVHSQSPPVETSSSSSKSSRRSHKEKAKKSQQDERRKSKTSHRDNVRSGSDSESNRKEHKDKSEKELSKRRKESRTSGSNLIKREFSPTSERSSHRKDSSQAKQENLKGSKDRKHWKEDKHSNSDELRSNSNTKKRRHSEAYCSDNDSPKDKERRVSKDRHHTVSSKDEDEHAKPIKRVRKSSTKHEAPMSIASQSFLDEVIDDEVVDSGPETKEPSSQFRPRLSVKEEVVEVMPDMEVVETEVIDHSEIAETCEEVVDQPEVADIVPEDNEPVAEPSPDVEKAPEPATASKKVVGKVAIAQPFVSSYNPYSSTISSAVALMPVQLSKSKQMDDISKEGTSSEVDTSEKPASNLTELEKEKMHLQQLLTKLDSEQKLGLEEASEVADIYITGITQKIKSRSKKDTKEVAENVDRPEEQTETAAIPEPIETKPEPEILQEPSSAVEAPAEEQTVIEEVVADEVVTEVVEDEVVVEAMQEDEAPSEPTDQPKPIEDVDPSKSFRKQMEARRISEQRKREKEQKSLLKKQRKERERHKKLVEKMRPSQLVVSAVDIEEEEEEVVSKITGSSQNTPASAESPAVDRATDETNNTAPLTTANDEVIEDASAEVEVRSSPPKTESAKETEVPLETDSTPVSAKPDPQTTQTSDGYKSETRSSPSVTPKVMVPPSIADNSKQLPATTKSSGNTPLMAPPTHKTPVTVSPYTPKSASSQGKSSHTSQRSSSSNTNTPSPSQAKRKPHHHSEGHSHARRSSSSSHRHEKHGQRHHPSKYHPSDPKRRKLDHRQSSKHHEQERKRNTYSPPKPVTNLTVALNVSPSEPLGKKELETLKAELETMKSQLSLDMSPGFLSPSSEDETGVSPMSPILKSPTSERFTGLVDQSSEGKNLMVSPSQNRAQRLKQLGRVKKKVPLEDLTVVTVKEEEKIKEMKRKLEDQRQLEFRHMRLFRSSIFEQDSARLSHLQQTNKQEAVPLPLPSAPPFSGLGDLEIDNKPLFSLFVEKLSTSPASGTLKTHPTAEHHSEVPKNVFPLSSDITIPAPVESVSEIAGEADADNSAPGLTAPKSDDAEMSLLVDQPEKANLSVENMKEGVEEPSKEDTLPEQIASHEVGEEQKAVVENPVTLSETQQPQADAVHKVLDSTELKEPEPVTEESPELQISSMQEEIENNNNKIVVSSVQDVDTGTVEGEETSTTDVVSMELPESTVQDSTPHVALITSESHESTVTEVKESEKETFFPDAVEQTVDVAQSMGDDGVVEETVVSEVLTDMDDEYIESDLVIDAEDDVETPKMVNVEEKEDTGIAQVLGSSDKVKTLSAPKETSSPVSGISENVEDKSGRLPLKQEPETKASDQSSKDQKPVHGELSKDQKSSTVEEHKDKKHNLAPSKKEKLPSQSVNPSVHSGSSKEEVKTKKKKVDEKHSEKPDIKAKKLKKHKKVSKEPTSASSSPHPDSMEKSSKSSKESFEKKVDKVKKEKSMQKTEKRSDTTKSSKESSIKSKSEKAVSKDKEVPKHKHDLKKERKDMEKDKSGSSSKVQKPHTEVKQHKSSSQERGSVDSKASKVSSQEKMSATPSDTKSHKSQLGHTKSTGDMKHPSKSEKSATVSKPLHKVSGDKKLKVKHSEDKKKTSKPPKEGQVKDVKASKTDEGKHSHKSKSHSTEHHSDATKSVLKKDKHKHEPRKDAASSSSKDREEKKKHASKSKSHKPSTDADQPVKKKPRLGEVKKAPSKSSKSYLNLSDSDETPTSPMKKHETSQSKARSSKYWSSDSDTDEPKSAVHKPTKVEHSETKKPKTVKPVEPKPKQSFISSDSDSSDNFDSFISSINKSTERKSSKWEEKSDIYSASDEESDDNDKNFTENVAKPAAVQKISKPEKQADSDHSDRSSHHKQSPMIRKDSPSVHHHDHVKDKSRGRHKPGSSEKTSKSSLKSDKKKKLEKKAKKIATKLASKPEEEDKTAKHSKEKLQQKQFLDSDEEEEKPKPSKSKEKEISSSHHHRDTVEEAHKHAPVTSKLSSSSSSADSLDYPPSSPPSTLLTTKTIKSETLYNPDYKDPFSATSSSKKEQLSSSFPPAAASKSKPDPRSIYSTSSSDMDSDLDYNLEEKTTSSKGPSLSKEEREALLGTDSSDTDDTFSRLKPLPDVKPTEENVELKAKAQSSHTTFGRHTDQDDSKAKKKLTSKSSSVESKSSSKKTHGHKIKSSSEAKGLLKHGEVKSEKKKDKPKHDTETKKEIVMKPKLDRPTDHQKKHKVLSKDERSSSKQDEKHRESLRKVPSKPSGKHEKPQKLEKSETGKVPESQPKRHDGSSKSMKHGMEKFRSKSDHPKVKSKSSKPHDSSSVDQKRPHLKEEHRSRLGMEATRQEKVHSKDKKGQTKPTDSKLKKQSEPKPDPLVLERKKEQKAEKKPISSEKPHEPTRRESKSIKETPEESAKEEGNDSDGSMPGSSFFMASDTERPEKHLKIEPPCTADSKHDKTSDDESKSFSPKTHSSPMHTPTQVKSIFSPSQSFDAEERLSDQDAKGLFSTAGDNKPEARRSGSRKSSTSSNKSREPKKDTPDRKRSRSRELSPSESRKLALSALERCQMQHERKRKDLERLKNLNRQRDEEAVRSIMGGEESDDLVSSSSDADYLSSRISKSYSDNEPSTEAPFFPQPTIPKEEPAALPGDLTPEASVSAEKSDSELGKSDLEPRSKAEEIELAAAVSSIEGLFADFGENKQESSSLDTSYPQYEEPEKPETRKTPSPTETFDESGSQEAAEAASALLSESMYPPRDETPAHRTTVSPKKPKSPPRPIETFSMPTIRPAEDAPPRSRSIEHTAEVKKAFEAPPTPEERKVIPVEPAPKQPPVPPKQVPVQPPKSPTKLPAIKPIVTPKPEIPRSIPTPQRPATLQAENVNPTTQNVPESRPFVPLSTSKPTQPEPTVKETKHSPQIGVHAELPQALPLPSHRPTKDVLSVATPERKPPGFGLVHAIASPKQSAGAVGAKTNLPSPFVVQQHHPGVRGDPYALYGIPGPQTSPQKHAPHPAAPSQHALPSHSKVSPQASPTFKFPAASLINPAGAQHSPQHRPPGAGHVISPTTFVSPQSSNKAFASSHQHAAFTHPQATTTPEQTPPPVPTQSPSAVPPTLHSPVLQSRPPPISPHMASPKLPTPPVGNLPSPTVRHAQPMVAQAKPESLPPPPQNVQISTPASLYSPPAPPKHQVRPQTTAPAAPVHKPPETPPEPVRQPPPQTIQTTQAPQRPPGSQPLPYPPPASAPQYVPMVPYQAVPGQPPRLPPHGVAMEPPTTTASAKGESKLPQQVQIPAQYLYQQGVFYQNFPIGPGVSLPRSFGYIPGMPLPLTFSPQAARPPSAGEPPRPFGAPTHPPLTQSQPPPVAKSPHVEKTAPQAPSRGRATPGTPKHPATPQSPRMQSAPPPVQGMSFGAGRALEQRPAVPEPSSRLATASQQQDASAMVAQHFMMSGFPSSPHRHPGPPVFQPRPGMPPVAGFTPQMYRPEMGTPPFSHHIPTQPPTSQTRPPTSGHFYPPPEQQQISAPTWKPEKQEPQQPPKQPADHPAMYHPPAQARTSGPEPSHPHQHRAPAHHPYQHPPAHQEPVHHPPPAQQPPSHAPRPQVPPHQTIYHPPTQPYRPRFPQQPAEHPQTQPSPYQPPRETQPPPQTQSQVVRRAPSPAPEQGKEAQTSLENLFSRYPVIWQGKVAIKNEFAAVQIHYVCGNMELAESGLPKVVEDESGLYVLRIARRMRLYPPQLESLHSRMGTEGGYCMLLALPCGRDKEDIVRQTNQLSTSFIKYLKDKEVAGISETKTPAEDKLRILHIFPPCNFTNGYLQQRAPDLLSNVADIQHLPIVITHSA